MGDGTHIEAAAVAGMGKAVTGIAGDIAHLGGQISGLRAGAANVQVVLAGGAAQTPGGGIVPGSLACAELAAAASTWYGVLGELSDQVKQFGTGLQQSAAAWDRADEHAGDRISRSGGRH